MCVGESRNELIRDKGTGLDEDRSFADEQRAMVTISCIEDADRLIRACGKYDYYGRASILKALFMSHTHPPEPGGVRELAEYLLDLNDAQNARELLEKWPSDTCEWLILMLRTCKKGWFKDQLLHYLKTAEKRLKNTYNENTEDLFYCVIDCNLWLLKEHIPRNPNITADELHRLISKFKEKFPLNESGYLKEAELYICCGQTNQAISLLTGRVLNLAPDESDTERGLVCPWCCKLLLDLLINRSDDYKIRKIIAEKGEDFSTIQGNKELEEYFRDQLDRIERVRRRREDRQSEEAGMTNHIDPLTTTKNKRDLCYDMRPRGKIKCRYAAHGDTTL